MVRNVNRRLLRTLIYVLVTAQVVSFAPLGVSTASTAPHGSAAGSEMACADAMHAGDQSKKSCPCCPDGANRAAACSSACTATAAAIPALVLPTVRSSSGPIRIASSTARADLPDPPLKPPPIV